MKQILSCKGTTAGTTTAYYSLCQGFTMSSNTENNIRCVIPTGGTLRNLRIRRNFALDVSQEMTFTVVKNGTATSLSAVIDAEEQTGEDLTNEVSVSAGDQLTLKSEATNGSPSNAIPTWSVEFESSSAQKCAIMGAGQSQLSFNETRNSGIMGVNTWTATEANVLGVIPTAGTLTALYVRSSANIEVDGEAAFTVRVNGSNTALTCTISDGTTASITGQSVAVSAGDTIAIRVATNSDTGSFYAGWGVLFEPTVDGESVLIGGTGENTPTSNEYWNGCSCVAEAWSDNELVRHTLSSATTLKKLYVKLATAPGAGKDYSFTVYDSESPTALTCTIADTDTTGNDTTNTVSVSDYGLITIALEGTSTPAASKAYWGMVSYIPTFVDRYYANTSLNATVNGVVADDINKINDVEL